MSPKVHESKENRKHEEEGDVEEEGDHKHPLGPDPPPLNEEHHHRVVEDAGNVPQRKIQEILQDSLHPWSSVD